MMSFNPANAYKDPVLTEKCIRASNLLLDLTSGDGKLYGRVRLPERRRGSERSIAVAMLHGYPGFELNVDVAEALRRAGAVVITFHYRGLWGSGGFFSFANMIADVKCVVEHVRAKADEFLIDTDRIYLIGHSMGGFAGLNAMADGVKVRGGIFAAPCDIAYKYLHFHNSYRALISQQSEGYFHLQSVDDSDNEMRENSQCWCFASLADKLDAAAGIHFIGAAADSATPPGVNIAPLYAALTERGVKTTYTEFDDEHTFPSSRIALTNTIARLIGEMEKSL